MLSWLNIVHHHVYCREPNPMENVVPGALQRLRAADILRMAGLAAASLGQEYCRSGAVRSTQRQGARISGVVDVPHAGASPVLVDDVDAVQTEANRHHYHVEIELQGPTTWVSSCSCEPDAPMLCAHAAALLYQWLARPTSFATISASPLSSSSLPEREMEPAERERHQSVAHKSVRAVSSPRPIVVQRGPTPLSTPGEIVGQMGLTASTIS